MSLFRSVYLYILPEKKDLFKESITTGILLGNHFDKCKFTASFVGFGEEKIF